MVDITVGLAFIAGLVSFISPCVLPLVPAYIGYMGGQATSQLAAAGGNTVATQRSRVNTVTHGLFFVLGFTLVFVIFGLLTTAGSLALRGSVINMQEILARLGGLIIIIFGLHVMGLLPRFIAWVLKQTDAMNHGAGLLITLAVEAAIAVILAWSLVTPIPQIIGVVLILLWLLFGGKQIGDGFLRPGDFWKLNLTRLQTALYSDTRQQMQMGGNRGYTGSMFMGVVFSAGWTPCIGPVYGAVLTLAANGGSLTQAGALLTAYSLGLGVPFLLTAILLDRAYGLLRGLQRHMRKIELASGVFLLVIGFLVLSGQLARLSQIGTAGDFAFNLETCTTEAFAGHISWGEFGECMSNGGFVPEEADAGADAATSDEGGLLNSVSALGSTDETVELPVVGLGEGFLAPTFATTTHNGDDIALSTALGDDVTILNFWATWCGPCRVEMPAFQALYEDLGDEGVQVLAVNMGESADRIAEFQEEFGVTFPLLLDEDSTIAGVDYQVLSLPTTYVLDSDGVILVRHFGPATPDQLDEFVELAMAEPAE